MAGFSCAFNKMQKWCDDNFLDLKVSETKELIIDFRQIIDTPKVNIIHSKNAEIVDSYKFLVTVFDSQLKFDVNTKPFLFIYCSSSILCNTVLCNFFQSFIWSL